MKTAAEWFIPKISGSGRKQRNELLASFVSSEYVLNLNDLLSFHPFLLSECGLCCGVLHSFAINHCTLQRFSSGAKE